MKSGTCPPLPPLRSFAPSRGRELKYATRQLQTPQAPVRPLAGAGIEMVFSQRSSREISRFAPSRGRELKSKTLT